MEKPREACGAVARRERSRGCVGGEVRGTLRSSTSRHVAPRGGGACRVDSARGASYAFLGTQAKGQVPSARVPRVDGLLRPNHGGAVDVRANVDVRRASALTNRATVHVATLRVVVRRRRRVRVAGTKKGPVLDGANPTRRRDMRADVAVARHRVQGDPRTRPRRPTRSRRTMRTGLEAPRQRQGGAADPVEKVLRERR